ncbi:Multidrug export protein MepA, partial [Dysosmobacter welbionis]
FPHCMDGTPASGGNLRVRSALWLPFYGHFHQPAGGRAVLPEGKAVAHIVRQRLLHQLQGHEIGADRPPNRVHQQPRPGLVKDLRQRLELLVGPLPCKGTLSPENAVCPPQILQVPAPQGDLVGCYLPPVLHRAALRVVRPGVVLIAHGFQQQILTSSVIQRESAVIPAGVPLHRAGQRPGALHHSCRAGVPASRQKIERLLRFASAGHCCPASIRQTAILRHGIPPPGRIGGLSGASRSEGGRILPFCTLPGQDQPQRLPRRSGASLPVGPSAREAVPTNLPSAGPRRRPVRLPWGRRCRRRSLRGRRGGCGLRLFRASAAQHQPPQGGPLPQQHLPDVFHLSPPSTPGTAPDQSPGSPPPERGRVPPPPDGAAVFPSPRRSARPGPPRRRGTPASPGAGSSLPAPGRCTAGRVPGAPLPAPGSPARSPAAARPWAAAARPVPP